MISPDYLRVCHFQIYLLYWFCIIIIYLFLISPICFLSGYLTLLFSKFFANLFLKISFIYGSHLFTIYYPCSFVILSYEACAAISHIVPAVYVPMPCKKWSTFQILLVKTKIIICSLLIFSIVLHYVYSLLCNKILAETLVVMSFPILQTP
jgi:hypothetical protein